MDLTLIGLSSLGISVAGFGLYKAARPHFQVKVNCWFCSTNSKVEFSRRNSWTCQSCSQYNGFTADGDYNRDIPEQRLNPDEEPDVKPLHFAVREDPSSSTSSPVDKGEEGNGLCRTCNLNQELKVHQLRNFVPSHPDRYDDEVQEYQQHLERTYRLCRYCEATLYQTLGEQDSWIKPKLLAWKLELSRQSPLSSALKLCKSTRDKDTVQRRIALVLSLTFFAGTIFSGFFPHHSFEQNFTLEVGYRQIVTSFLLVILTVYGLNPWVVIKHACHQFCVITWIFIFFISVKEESILSLLSSTGETSPRFYLRFCASLLCLVASWYSSKLRSSEDKKMSAKQLKKSKTRKIFQIRSPHFTHPSTIDEEEEEVTSLSEKDETLTQDLLSSTSASVSSKTTTSKTATKSPLRPPIRAPQFGAFLPNHEVHHGEIERTFNISGEEEHEDCVDQQVNPPCDLSVLHIDRAGSSCGGRSPPFEVKRYDAANTSGINFGFGEASTFARFSTSRPVLKPPRFVYEQPHRVAQSSWVAGGYWHQGGQQQRSGGQFGSQHPGVLPDNLSRSSSQTSGFVSVSNEDRNVFSTSSQPLGNFAFSSLPNSRVNSVCGDRHSVLSEPVYTNHGSADMSLRSLGNQLAFFDTTRRSWNAREDDPVPTRKSRTIRDLDEDSDSMDSSVGRLNQEAFSVFKPKAESSPIEKANRESGRKKSEESFLEKKIQISFSLYSLFFVVSVTLNVAVIWYLVIK